MSFKRAMRRRQSRRMDNAIKKRKKYDKLNKQETRMKNSIDTYIDEIKAFEDQGYNIVPSDDMHSTSVYDDEDNLIANIKLEKVGR